LYKAEPTLKEWGFEDSHEDSKNCHLPHGHGDLRKNNAQVQWAMLEVNKSTL